MTDHPTPRHEFDRVLVTGATGFVGRYLMPALASSGSGGARVFAAGRSSAGVQDGEIPLDLTERASVRSAIQSVRPDLIIHLAAHSSVGQAAGAAGEAWAANLCGSLYMAEAVAELAPSATVLFASSAEVYGAAYNDGTADEDVPPRPLSVYARSKLAAEAMFGDVLTATNRLIVVRPSNHSGLGQDTRFVLPSFAQQIVSGAEEIRVGNLDVERDFLHVEDVIGAYLALVSQAPDLPLRGQVFNIASGEARLIGDLLARMIALAGSDAQVVVDPERVRAAEVPIAKLSSARIQQACGWRPVRDVDDILRDVLAGQREALPGAPGHPGKARDGKS